MVWKVCSGARERGRSRLHPQLWACSHNMLGRVRGESSATSLTFFPCMICFLFVNNAWTNPLPPRPPPFSQSSYAPTSACERIKKEHCWTRHTEGLYVRQPGGQAAFVPSYSKMAVRTSYHPKLRPRPINMLCGPMRYFYGEYI